LQSSKSPVIDALVYCALTNQGLTLIEAGNTIVRFRMHDFPLYYKKSQGIGSWNAEYFFAESREE